MELLLFWIVMGIVVGIVASSKGRSFVAWSLYGVIIWPIALVHILVSKRYERGKPISGAFKPDFFERGVPWRYIDKKNLVALVDGREVEFKSYEQFWQFVNSRADTMKGSNR